MIVTEEFKSSTHPKHYLMHKYWGRKAHNLLAELIEKNTKPGQIVLDPYMGSGVAIIEANKAGRLGIGFDLNPVSKLIVDVTLNPIDSLKFERHLHSILQFVESEINSLQDLRCPICGEKSRHKNSVWDKNGPARVKLHCDIHGIQTRHATLEDFAIQEKSAKVLNRGLKAGRLFVPRDEMFKFVRRSGLTTIDQLFSSRNLLTISLIHSRILQIKEKKIRDAFLLAFTSMLPNVSKMIPGDLDTVNGKSGWQISKFWAPSIHTEKDVLESFVGRCAKILAGITEMDSLRTDAYFSVRTRSSSKLVGIDDSSIDFIFADPPYGDSISYLALSMFWNVWLNKKVHYAEEVVFDTNRKKGLEEYREGLVSSFMEMFRVLKPQGKLVVTFNNRHSKFWFALMDAISTSGFRMTNVTWVDQAVRSGTQGINKNNTLHGDFVYTFVKRVGSVPKKSYNGPKLIDETLSRHLNPNSKLTASEMYRLVLPVLISNQALMESPTKYLNIEGEISKYCEYKEIKIGKQRVFMWVRSND